MRNDGREPVLMQFLGVKVDKVAGSLLILYGVALRVKHSIMRAGRSSLK